MTDRELLEMAAKAARLTDWYWSHADKTIKLHGTDVGYEWPEPKRWNPLENDGDALRLAVRCAQLFGFYRFLRAWLIAMATENGSPADPCAATRRAIVRAAAEIGRRMSDDRRT